MTIIPEFDSSVHEYAATTTNATNKVTATPTDPDAEITIMLGDTEIENGSFATWVQGEGNRIEVTVDGTSEKYVVMVTAYPKQQSDEEVVVDLDGKSFRIGAPTFDGTAIDAAITAQTVDASASLNIEAGGGTESVLFSILPVVSDAETNEYTEAGITLEQMLVVSSYTKKYAIGAVLTATGIDIINPDKIEPVDSEHVKIPFMAIRAFENLSNVLYQGMTMNLSSGWNIALATVDTATYSDVSDIEVVEGAVDLNDYVLLSEGQNDLGIAGISGSDIYNGIVYILP